MSESFTGQMKIFAGKYAPRKWVMMEGQLLQVSQFQELFSLLNTTYGGDGRLSFGLPDMRGRIAVSYGQGPELRQWLIGEKAGAERITLTLEQIPAHNHPVQASTDQAVLNSPVGAILAKVGDEMNDAAFYKNAVLPLRQLAENAIALAGSNAAHQNQMKYLCLSFVMLTAGVYPVRG